MNFWFYDTLNTKSIKLLNVQCSSNSKLGNANAYCGIAWQENRRRQQQQQQQQSSSGAGASGGRPQAQSSSGQDDREGVLNHPKRGRIPTYIFQVNLT